MSDKSSPADTTKPLDPLMNHFGGVTRVRAVQRLINLCLKILPAGCPEHEMLRSGVSTFMAATYGGMMAQSLGSLQRKKSRG